MDASIPPSPKFEAISDDILILGDSREALALTRGLRQAGLRPHAGTNGSCQDVLRFSRFLAGRWSHPPLGTSSDEELVAAMVLAQQKLDRPVRLFPVGEEAIVRCLEVAPMLPDSVQLVTATPEAVRTCIDKDRARKLFDECAVPQPATRSVSDRGELLQALDQVGLPAIVKPVVSGGWSTHLKAIVLRDPAEVASRLRFWDEAKPLLVQSRAHGTRHNVYFAAREGRLLAGAEVEILRTDRPDDTGLAVEGVVRGPIPARLRPWCESLVERMEYTGAGCMQFLIDPKTGRAEILEINPRLGANFAVVQKAGLNLALLSVLLPSEPERAMTYLQEDFQPKLVRYVWLSGDLAGLGVHLRNRSIGAREASRWAARMAAASLRAGVHVTWTWRDPLPTLAFVARLGLTVLPSWCPNPFRESSSAVEGMKRLPSH